MMQHKEWCFLKSELSYLILGSSLVTHVSLQGGKDFEDGLGI